MNCDSFSYEFFNFTTGHFAGIATYKYRTFLLFIPLYFLTTTTLTFIHLNFCSSALTLQLILTSLCVCSSQHSLSSTQLFVSHTKVCCTPSRLYSTITRLDYHLLLQCINFSCYHLPTPWTSSHRNGGPFTAFVLCRIWFS